MVYLEIGCQVLLALVFGWSAASKLNSRVSFRQFAVSLRPVVWSSPIPVAVAVVSAEVMVPPLALLVPTVGFALACCLLLVLTAGVLSVLYRRLAVQCRCFGPGTAVLGARHVIRNLLLLVVSGFGLGLTALSGRSTAGGPGIVLAAAAAVVLASVFIMFDDVVELFT